MCEDRIIQGFSKMDIEKKIEMISKFTLDPEKFKSDLKYHLHPEKSIQDTYSEFSENTLTNFYLPWGIAPNFLINDKIYHVPMVTEESSVIAAAASAAKYWMKHGGFKTKVVGTEKKGQVHFIWKGNPKKFLRFFETRKRYLSDIISPLTSRMEERGGGILEMKLKYQPEILNHYYELDISFDTADSMGANFINSCLEEIAKVWKSEVENNIGFNTEERNCDIIMAILSNYTPDCRVICDVSENIHNMKDVTHQMSQGKFVEKFVGAMEIAKKNISRAVTHNKGIMNGIDAVAVATGNDFRANEANAHAFASRSGFYKSLSDAKVENGTFSFSLTIPVNLGVTGGLTSVHPFAGYSVEILGNPSARELMGICASVGLANNFSAIRSLVTTGIQKGHMKLHLNNILNSLNADSMEKKAANIWFQNKTLSYSSVLTFLDEYRKRRKEN
ncbi:MAG: hypothetical protein JW894_08035 [Bacteroidales bacterium]|nr:hypothetical protein [Bacteroidales bacterium]